MMSRSLVRAACLALACGGALTLLINAGLTPFVRNSGLPFTDVAASSLFLWRQSLSALAAALLLFGSIGLHPGQDDRAGIFGSVAFAMAFFGSALLLAWEWIDVFILHDLALRAPDTLRMLEEAKGLHFYDLGAIVPIGLFTLGWIALAASKIRGCPALRRAAALLIAGFFATPLLSAALGSAWGGALGNAVLGSGWIWLGLGAWKRVRTREMTRPE